MKISPAFIGRIHFLNLSRFKGFPGITGRFYSRLSAIIFCAILCFALPLSAEQYSVEKVFEAVENNDIDTVRNALDSGFDVNSTRNDNTLLGYALIRDLEKSPKREIIKLILQYPKLQINKTHTYVVQIYQEDTPLMTASEKGMTDIVEIILKKKANINTRRIYNGAETTIGLSPLMAAAAGGHLETVRLLLKYKPNLKFIYQDNMTALDFAIELENLEMVKILHEAGIKLNRKINKGNSILTLTFIHKKFEVLDYLIDQGADINFIGPLGQTPLNFCAATQKNPMVKHLLERGADVTIPDQEGQTPLSHAINWRNKEMIDILRKGGASFKNQKVGALSMLSYFEACADSNPLDHKKNLGIIKDTLDCELNPNFQSTTGKTGLMAAVTEEYYKKSHALEKAALLIKKGASPDIADKSGVTALMIAASRGNLELVQLMVDNGANIKIKDKAGQTANSYASQAGKDKVTKYLISKGATPDSDSSAKSTTNPRLLGSWQGTNTQKPRTLCYLTLESNNRFDFQYRNLSNKVIEKQKGTYTAQKDTLIFMIPGKKPLTRKWVYSDGFLFLDKVIQLQKIE